MKTNFFKLVILIVTTFILHGCGEEKAGTWKNDQIPSGKKEKFHTLNDEVFKYLKGNDAKGMKNVMTQELIEETYTLRQIETAYNLLLLNDYKIYDEYYTVNKWKNTDTITNNTRGKNSYKLKFDGTAREMYIVFFVPKKGNYQEMITLMYAKLDYGWKLFKLDQGPFIINGKTGPELFRLAQEKMNKKYLSDAVSTLALATTCMHPADILVYPDDSLEKVYYKEAINMANAVTTYPLVVNKLPTHPSIFRIHNEKTPDGYFPTIYYQSTVSLKDTAALNKENRALQKVIGKIIPGIDKDKKYLLYQVFNQMPNVKVSVDRYPITQAIDK